MQVADQIRDAVSTGKLVPGQALPAERDLATQFGVSRTTIREALRALQAQGVISTQGTAPLRAVVASGDSIGLTDALEVLLQFGRVSPLGLVDFQSILESAAIDRAILEPRHDPLAAGRDGARPPPRGWTRPRLVLPTPTPASTDAIGAAAQSEIIDLSPRCRAHPAGERARARRAAPGARRLR